MNKLTLVLIASVALLAGCEEGHTSIEKNGNNISKVQGFEDCVSFVGYVSGIRAVIVRCPNSSVNTSFAYGKTTQSSIVVSDEELAKDKAAQSQEYKDKLTALTKAVEIYQYQKRHGTSEQIELAAKNAEALRESIFGHI